MTLRLIAGVVLLGCVCARSLGEAPGSMETLVVGLVKKESRDLGETILKMIDDKSGTLQKVVKRVSEDKELRGLVLKAVEGLNAVVRVAGEGDVDAGVELKTSMEANNSTATSKEFKEDDREGTISN